MKFFLILALLLPLAASAQEPDSAGPVPATRCDSAGYRQFDFWIGDWDVTSGGQPAGKNSIHPILNGCALQENWQGAGEGGIRGTSFNIYDQATGLWHQTWVDNSGMLLLIEAGLVESSMVLSGMTQNAQGAAVTNRITWTPVSADSVRQIWETSTDQGKNWSVVFDGMYVRR